MEFSCRSADEILVAAVSGRVDEASWQQFADQMKEAVDQAAEGRQSEVMVDLTCLDYMSSRGLRVLTMAKRQAEGLGLTITLASPNEVMREILAISRYDKLFHISDSVDTGR
ncbi:MAG: STAS domain-containing protein [Sphingomonas sp.]|nr:STAS domain-containing protein [Sphingomonas sp.]